MKNRRRKHSAHMCGLGAAVTVGVGLLASVLFLVGCDDSAPIQVWESEPLVRESVPPEMPQYPVFAREEPPLEEVVVAILDAGIDCTIPDLAEKMWRNPNEIPGNGIDDDYNGYIDDVHGWDFREDDNSSMNGPCIHWHGTFVAGIISGVNQTASVVPIRLMDLRFLDCTNQFFTMDWWLFAEAIEYAVNNGAHIINLSFFSYDRPPGMVEAILEWAVTRGVVVVGITGNHSSEGILYPAKYPSVLAISATDQDGSHLASSSGYGPGVVLSAPGEDVVSLVPGGDQGIGSGTSWAAAYVSGAIARVLSYYPELSAREAVDLLCDTARDIYAEGYDTKTGYGLVDSDSALRAAGANSPSHKP